MKFLKLFLIICLINLNACSVKKEEETMQTVPSSLLSTEYSLDSYLVAENTSFANDVGDDYFDDDYFDDDYDDYYTTEQYPDPLKPWNKVWFRVNDFFLLKIAKPIHKGYEKVVHSKFRSGISNFKNNLKAPARMTNALLQGEVGQFFVEFGKFMINTVTSAGFADVASRNKPLVKSNPENLRFGYTLAKWGVPQGPYFILPFFGPSTIREGLGVMGDLAASPQRYILPWEASLILSAPLEINSFGDYYKAYETLVGSSIDPYISLKNAYLDHLNHTEVAKD